MNNENLIKERIEASLMDNYFLHYAGSWYEIDMWGLADVFGTKEKHREVEEYYKYLDTPVTGTPKGQIKPS